MPGVFGEPATESPGVSPCLRWGSVFMLVVCTSAIMVSTKASVCRWPPSHADQVQSPSPSPFAVKQARSHNPTGQRGQVSPSSKAQPWWAQTAPPRQQPEDGALAISKLWKTRAPYWFVDVWTALWRRNLTALGYFVIESKQSQMLERTVRKVSCFLQRLYAEDVVWLNIMQWLKLTRIIFFIFFIYIFFS